MTAYLALVRTHILQFLGNRRAVLMTLIAPIVIAATFGSLFGGAQQRGPSQVPVALTDLDDSAASRELTTALQAKPVEAAHRRRLPRAPCRCWARTPCPAAGR